ncbi:MAG: DNA mismatch repair protein MutS [Bacteroidota bacterium]
MKQYNKIKAKHPGALLLFRVGDFYETFGEDAVKAAKILGIILTKRKNGSASHIELAGFPHHSLEVYLPKLVRAGERVAVCDQLEDPKMTKKIVKRGVTELVTPGVAMNDQVLEQNKNNFLAAVHIGKKKNGVAFLDISTGEFLTAEGNFDYIDKVLQGFEPSEVLYSKQQHSKYEEHFSDRFYTFKLEDWVFTEDFGRETLLNHFGTKNLKGFGVDKLSHGIVAAGAILHYISEAQHDKVGHITKISRIEEDKYVWLDRFTVKNLELAHPQHENGGTLLDVIDGTVTPMGGRLMKRWVLLPLKEKSQIDQRLDAVGALMDHDELRFEMGERLKEINDLERLASKVAVGKINPKEVNQLKKTLQQVPPIIDLLQTTKEKALLSIADRLNPCHQLLEIIEEQLFKDAAIQVGKGQVIADGFNEELDEYRRLSNSSRTFLEQLQQRESERTGITSLKVAFNNVFGYYIEVRNTHKDKVPEEWIRKQTLVSAERYITEELKEYEQKILGAEEKILVLERQLFQDLVFTMADYINPIQFNAQLLAQLDGLTGFANISQKHAYNRPNITEDYSLDIKEGRHPVIEQQMPLGEAYIPNDIYIDNDSQQIMMITGPNMSGKSALLRQTALISLMAQIGCYVPAKRADLGIVDKVFTRVGASDNISSGESTFMVEMNETASILNNLSPRSLVLLDEIGRGTSTYDGISIAWAIAEYIHQHPSAHCKTLFATHYHELNEMTNKFSRIKNFTVAVKEVGTKILFLRKLVEGGSEHSFGIHVAKLAGMPNPVVERASKMLKELEASNRGNDREKVKEAGEADDMQLSFFQLDDPVLEQIRDEVENMDVDTLTPVEALFKLNEIKKLTGGNKNK